MTTASADPSGLNQRYVVTSARKAKCFVFAFVFVELKKVDAFCRGERQLTLNLIRQSQLPIDTGRIRDDQCTLASEARFKFRTLNFATGNHTLKFSLRVNILIKFIDGDDTVNIRVSLSIKSRNQVVGKDTPF